MSIRRRTILSVTAAAAALGAVLAVPLLSTGIAVAAPATAAQITFPFPIHRRAQPTPTPVAATQSPEPTDAPATPEPTAAPATPEPTAAPTAVAVATATPRPAPTPVPTPAGPTAAQLAQLAEMQRLAAIAAAEAQRKAAALAAKRAAELADAGQRATAAWQKRGKPNKMVIIRPTAIDSVSNGQLVQHVIRVASTTSLSALDANVPAGWITVNGGTAQLAAAVLVTPGATFDVNGITTLRLVGGAAAQDAAFLYTGSGAIRLTGLTVTSIDPSTSAPVAAAAAGRPYIDAASGGRLDVVNTTVDQLGIASTGEAKATAAVTFGLDSGGSLDHTTLTNNSVGIELTRSKGIKLQDVTVSNSAGDGIDLFSDQDTTFGAITVDHNGANGINVSGPSTTRPINGITTNANGDYGVSLTGQTNTDIGNLTLGADQAGGLELNHMIGTKVHDISTTDEPVGAYVHVFSSNVTLDKATMSGGRTAVQIDKSTTGMNLSGSTLVGAEVVAVSVGGKQTTIADTTVRDSRTAVKVERGAAGITATGLSVIGGQDGLVTSGGTSGVVVKDLTSDSVAGDAIRNLSDGMQVTGGTISGGDAGLDLQGGTSITGTQIGVTTTGIRVRTTSPVMISGVTVNAVQLGIDVAAGSAVTLQNSVVHALTAIRGTVKAIGNNDLSLPPLNLLGAIGVPLLLLAVALELFHLTRSRSTSTPRRRVLPPVVPVGAR